MTPHVPNPNQLPSTGIDTALSACDDVILPSSGFADAVMAAVHREASAPAPIAFPWKRAIPGLIAAAGALAFLVAMFVALFRFRAGAPAEQGSAGWRAAAAAVQAPAPRIIDGLWFTQLAHSHLGADALWVALSLAIPLLCVLLMRRLLFGR